MLRCRSFSRLQSYQDRCFAAAVGGVRKNRTLTTHPSAGHCRVPAVPAGTHAGSTTCRQPVLASTGHAQRSCVEISTP